MIAPDFFALATLLAVLPHLSSAIFPAFTSGLLQDFSRLSILKTALLPLLMVLVMLVLSIHFLTHVIWTARRQHHQQRCHHRNRHKPGPSSPSSFTITISSSLVVQLLLVVLPLAALVAFELHTPSFTLHAPAAAHRCSVRQRGHLYSMVCPSMSRRWPPRSPPPRHGSVLPRPPSSPSPHPAFTTVYATTYVHDTVMAGGSGGGVASVHPHLAPGIEAASQLRTSSQARLEGLRQSVAGLNPMAFPIWCGMWAARVCCAATTRRIS